MSTCPVTPVGLRTRQRRQLYLSTALWLVFLLWLIWPVIGVVTSPAPGWVTGITLALTAVFAGIYAFGVVCGVSGRSERVPKAATAVLVVIPVGLVPLIGDVSAAYLIFTAVLTIFAWPLRVSLPALAVFTTWAAVLPVFVGSGGSPRWLFPLLVAGIGLLNYVSRRLTIQGQEIQRAHEQLAELAVADERARFGRDVHDILGHSLTSIVVKAQLAGRLLDFDGEKTRAEITDIERLAREGLEDVRRTAAGYREVTLSAELASARAALAAAGIDAELPQAVDEVPGRLRELFGWAVREGVTNVIRHSGASRCAVRLSPTTVEVVDDGGASPGSPAHTGNGLSGLADRAAAAGAAFDAKPLPDGGFKLSVRLEAASAGAHAELVR
jgi:two-component system sensor histidine kinase DesK